jgi:hypothetical protein
MNVNPLIGERFVRKQNVQSLINAQDKRDPFELIDRDRRDLALFHFEEGSSRRPPQQRLLLFVAEVPFPGDIKKRS